MITGPNRYMHYGRSANEAEFRLTIILGHNLLRCLPLAFVRSGIFGQATTKGASTAKSRRRWYGWYCGVGVV